MQKSKERENGESQKHVVDADGFTIVRRKSRHRGVARISHERINRLIEQNKTIDEIKNNVDHQLDESRITLWLKRYEKYKRQLKRTPLFSMLCQQISSIEFDTVICYGLGRLGIHRCDLQLALLCLLLESCEDITTGQQEERYRKQQLRKLSYDPMHDAMDKEILSRVGMTPLETSTLGEDVDTSSRVLLFMPHCERWMYSKVVETRLSYGGFSNMFIIGNSFKEYLRMDDKKVDWLNQAVDLITEINCPLHINDSDDCGLDPGLMFDAFNNMRFIKGVEANGDNA